MAHHDDPMVNADRIEPRARLVDELFAVSHEKRPPAALEYAVDQRRRDRRFAGSSRAPSNGSAGPTAYSSAAGGRRVDHFTDEQWVTMSEPEFSRIERHLGRNGAQR